MRPPSEGGATSLSPEGLVDRVREALGRDGRPGEGEPSAPPPAPPGWARFNAPLEASARAERFVAAARALGAEVVEVAAGEVEAAVARTLADAGATRVGYASDCGLAAAGQGLELSPFSLDAGVTGVTAAIARSGALVLDSGPGRPGALSSVVPLHVAVVPARVVVASLAEALAAPSPDQGSARVLIAGPSKTADIEGILITGVHGPGRVAIVFVRG